MRENFTRILFASAGPIAVLLALACAPALTAAQEPPAKTLTIAEIEAIPLYGPAHPDRPGSLYYRLEAAYPQDWQDEVENTFRVEVDGHPASYQATGTGFGGGTATADFWVYLGMPGKKKVEVTLVKDGKTVSAEKEFTVPPETALNLLDHYDGECLLANQTLNLIVFGVNDPVVKVNGQPVKTSTAGINGFDGISIVTIPPSLRAGKNSIEYAGTDAEGKRVSGGLSLYYAAGNEVKVGDHFLFTYGRVASKSGPFYYVGADGEVLVNTGGVQWEAVLKQDKKGWIGAIDALGNPILAKKAGKGMLTLSVKPFFLQPTELEKKIEFTVEP